MNSSLDVIETFHNDIVHDISFDWYGRRLATCSSDQKIKIWSKGADNKWIKVYDFPAHDAEIFKVKWAHPDFGSIIATCSYDKSVIIWEEPKMNSFTTDQENMQEPSSSTVKSWTLKTRLLESKEAVLDIEFAPKHQGLVLAAATVEGIVRIYEAPEIMNLQSWRIIGEIMASTYGINSISWNKNPYDPAMLAIGCKDEYSSEQRGDLVEQMEEKMNVPSQKTEDKLNPLNK
jgi:nucleoporin SEH1